MVVVCAQFAGRQTRRVPVPILRQLSRSKTVHTIWSSVPADNRTLQPQNTRSERNRYTNANPKRQLQHHLMNNQFEMCNEAVVPYFGPIMPKIFLERDLRNHKVQQQRYSMSCEVRDPCLLECKWRALPLLCNVTYNILAKQRHKNCWIWRQTRWTRRYGRLTALRTSRHGDTRSGIIVQPATLLSTITVTHKQT